MMTKDTTMIKMINIENHHMDQIHILVIKWDIAMKATAMKATAMKATAMKATAMKATAMIQQRYDRSYDKQSSYGPQQPSYENLKYSTQKLLQRL